MNIDKLKRHIVRVLEYAMPDEVEDYQEQEADARKAHILHDLVALNNFVTASGLEQTTDEVAGIAPVQVMPSLDTYVSDVDGTVVVHVDTMGMQENDVGPVLRVYINDDVDDPVFNNPLKD